MRTRDSVAGALAGKFDAPSAVLADAFGMALQHLELDGGSLGGIQPALRNTQIQKMN
jgi:hypothetical protein